MAAVGGGGGGVGVAGMDNVVVAIVGRRGFRAWVLAVGRRGKGSYGRHCVCVNLLISSVKRKGDQV